MNMIEIFWLSFHTFVLLALPQLLGYFGYRYLSKRRMGFLSTFIAPVFYFAVSYSILSYFSYQLSKSGSRCGTPLVGLILMVVFGPPCHFVVSIIMYIILRIGERRKRRFCTDNNKPDRPLLSGGP